MEVSYNSGLQLELHTQSPVTVEKRNRGSSCRNPIASSSLICAVIFQRKQQKSLLGRGNYALYSSSVIHSRKTYYNGQCVI